MRLRRLRRAFAQIRKVAKTRPTPAARAEAHDLLGRLYLRRLKRRRRQAFDKIRGQALFSIAAHRALAADGRAHRTARARDLRRGWTRLVAAAAGSPRERGLADAFTTYRGGRLAELGDRAAARRGFQRLREHNRRGRSSCTRDFHRRL